MSINPLSKHVNTFQSKPVSMRSKKSLARFAYSIFCFGVFLLLASCSDGKKGDPGEPGIPGETIIINNEADTISITLDSVSISGKPVVNFSVVDQDGDPFTGLTQNEVRFNIAKLIPGTAGDSDRWQNYINRSESAGTIGPGTEDTVQGTTESNGVFENFQNGNYRYTFATDISAVTTPAIVEYQPSLVHRVALQVSGKFAPINETYTFIPQTGATNGFDQRLIVTTETCNGCHGQLALHGGGRIDTQYCVTCHNPGSTDAQSGNTVDFKVMIHKIHRGAFLPSVVSGDDYIIYGFRNSEHNFSDIHFPQNIKNCTRCHDQNNAQTPQAANWFSRPSLEACGSCHDDIDFAAGVAGGHEGGVVTDNSECTTCHAENRVAGSVIESHAMPESFSMPE